MKSKPSFMIEGMQAPSNIQIYIFDKELNFVYSILLFHYRFINFLYQVTIIILSKCFDSGIIQDFYILD